MSRFEVYTYTCAQHPIGTFVREVGRIEQQQLARVERPHFTNCWVKGCQMPLTQVRLVKDGGTAEAYSANREGE